MPQSQCDALVKRLWNLDTLTEMGELFALTRVS
jgi:hypothetical protein